MKPQTAPIRMLAGATLIGCLSAVGAAAQIEVVRPAPRPTLPTVVRLQEPGWTQIETTTGGPAWIRNDSTTLQVIVGLERPLAPTRARATSPLVLAFSGASGTVEYMIDVRSGAISRVGGSTTSTAVAELRETSTPGDSQRTIEAFIPLAELPLRAAYSTALVIQQDAPIGRGEVALTPPVRLPQAGAGPVAQPGMPIERRILADGKIELVFADGTIERKWGNCRMIIPPGAVTAPEMCFSAIMVSYDLPPLDGGNLEELPSWLEELNDDLLSYIRVLLGDDDVYVQRYLDSEVNLDAFRRAERRTRFIHELLK